MSEFARRNVFALFRGRLNVIGWPEGWTFEDGTFYEEPDEYEPGGPGFVPKTMTVKECFEDGFVFGDHDVPCVIQEWELDGVWATKEDAEEHAKQFADRSFSEGSRIQQVDLFERSSAILGQLKSLIGKIQSASNQSLAPAPAASE